MERDTRQNATSYGPTFVGSDAFQDILERRLAMKLDAKAERRADANEATPVAAAPSPAAEPASPRRTRVRRPRPLWPAGPGTVVRLVIFRRSSDRARRAVRR